MQQKLSMTIIEQAHARARRAKETNNGAAVREVPTILSNYGDIPELVVTTPPKNPYDNQGKVDSSFLTWNPLNEFRSHLEAVFAYIYESERAKIPPFSKAARLLDFDYWLEVNRRNDADFGGASLFEVGDLQKNCITLLVDLWKRYKATVKEPDQTDSKPAGSSLEGDIAKTNPFEGKNGLEPNSGLVPKNGISAPTSLAERLFVERLENLYFWLWYTCLAINVERSREVEHFTEMMEDACCSVQLENVSICVKLLAGHKADDRDEFLAKLRPYFQQHLARVKAKAITCDCGKGLG